MADVKISELPAAISANGSMEFEVNDGGTSRKVTGEQLGALFGGGEFIENTDGATITIDLSTGVNFICTEPTTSNRTLVFANLLDGSVVKDEFIGKSGTILIAGGMDPYSLNLDYPSGWSGQFLGNSEADAWGWIGGTFKLVRYAVVSGEIVTIEHVAAFNGV